MRFNLPKVPHSKLEAGTRNAFSRVISSPRERERERGRERESDAVCEADARRAENTAMNVHYDGRFSAHIRPMRMRRGSKYEHSKRLT